MTKLMTVQIQTAQPLTVRAFRGAQVLLLAALTIGSLGSASAQRRAAVLTQPVQQVQMVRNIPMTSAPVKPVTPPIQAIPTHPTQTPPDGCTWIYRYGWRLACRDMQSASSLVNPSLLSVGEQTGADSGTTSVPTGPQSIPTHPTQPPPAGCIWVYTYGWQLSCKDPSDLANPNYAERVSGNGTAQPAELQPLLRK